MSSHPDAPEGGPDYGNGVDLVLETADLHGQRHQDHLRLIAPVLEGAGIEDLYNGPDDEWGVHGRVARRVVEEHVIPHLEQDVTIIHSTFRAVHNPVQVFEVAGVNVDGGDPDAVGLSPRAVVVAHDVIRQIGDEERAVRSDAKSREELFAEWLSDTPDRDA